MQKVDKILRGRNNIVFIDFEGTQRTQEMIAIGAVSCSLNRDGTIKNMKPAFKRFVRSTTKVGGIVQGLTGIDDNLLRKEGRSFYDTMVELRKYVGLKWKKTLFVTYGNNDMRILNQTIVHNLNSPLDVCKQIQTNYWDFGTFINGYVKDENYQTLSLVHLCELYEIELATPYHDPAVDAINLANLYNAFLTKKEITQREYKKVITHNPKLPTSVQAVLKALGNNQNVTPEQFDEELKKELK